MDSVLSSLKDYATFKHGWKSWKSAAFWGAVGLTGACIAHKIYKIKNRKSFAGKNVLITGGAGVLGKQLTARFLREKANVIIWDINQKACKDAIKEMKRKFKKLYKDEDFGVPISYQIVDVRDVKEVKLHAEKLVEEFGDLDVLINNAGIVSRKTIFTASEEQIERVMDVNITSHFWTTRAFVPKMKENNSGHVVCVSSAAALAGVAGLQVYCASKWAAFGFAESLRLEFKREDCKVDTLIVMPYYMKGEMFDGVSSPLIPLLDPAYVADRIVLAMKERDTELIIPGWLRYISYGTRIVMPGLSDEVQHHLHITKSMDKVVGRKE